MMQNILSLGYKGFRRVYFSVRFFFEFCLCSILFYLNKVEYKNFKTKGLPKIMVARGGFFIIGKNFKMNNTIASNPIGCAQPCIFFVNKGAKLIIGDNTSLSQTALVCHIGINIGNYVKMGGGVCVYDTDFHSLDKSLRTTIKEDFKNKKVAPINIGDNVFIGAHSIILKGVTIGENSIVGASSLVTKNIPSNEIWGGNPAKKIKSLI